MSKNVTKPIFEQTAPLEAEQVRPDVSDPLIDAFKKDVDRTLLRENLKCTVEQRARKMQAFIKSVDAIRGTAQKSKT